MIPNMLTPAQIIPLWAPGQIDTAGWDQPEEVAYLDTGLKVIRNVVQPTLTAYPCDPAVSTGASVIVCPGGAWHFLAFEHEGTQVAEWLAARGVTVFMLKYRLIQTGADFPACVGANLNDPQRRQAILEPLMPLVTADGCQAVRLVRDHAAAWGLDPDRVGIMGFSAGGMVTLSTALHADSASRPAFAAPIYSAPPFEAPIPAGAPPLFLLCAADDGMASAVSTRWYADWRAAGHPVELHIYARGGHGFGMNVQGLPSDHWIERFADWLKGLAILQNY